MLGFAVDQGHALVRQIERRHQKRFVAGVLGVCGQKAEDIMHSAGNFRVRGKQAQVGVHSGGCGVVIAGADVRITAGRAVRIAPHQQRQLAVRL